MPSRSIDITVATFGWANKPTTPYYATARDRMRVDASTAYVYLKAIVDIPEGESFVSAQLRMATEDGYSGSRTFTLQRCNAPSSTMTDLTWNNKPATASGSTARTFTQNTTARLVTWDVTGDVSGRRTIYWRVISSDTTARHFSGTRAPSGSPRLVVVTTESSAEPTDLTPDAGAVSVASPVLQWNGRDDAIGYRVQIAAADATFSKSTGFTSPLYDSANVTPSDPDLVSQHTPAYSLTAGGTEYDWSVAYLLPSGLSAWSDPATITRIVKPSLTITNPLSTTNDPTPPVAWTTSGQVAWQVVRAVNGKTVANSKGRTGSDSSWAPTPVGQWDGAGITTVGAKKAGDVITDTVRIWDGVDRVGTPGDDEFTQAVKTSTYVPTNTVAPITNVSVTQVDDTPAVLVNYSRTTGIADEVLFDLNDEPVNRQAGIDGAWKCWVAKPNTDNVFELTAVVNFKASDVVKRAAFRTRVTGAWLVDPSTDRWFSVSGEGMTVAYGESSQTIIPIASAKTITRTSALRGPEDVEVVGRIDPIGGRTVEQQIADLWWMKSRPHRTYRLIAGDLNIPVTAKQMWAAFDSVTSMTHRIDQNARFVFSQTGDELPFEPI